MTDPLEPLRRQLLEAALVHVPFDGWTPKVLACAASDRGVAAGRAMVAFPGGARELMAYFLGDADRGMARQMADADCAKMRVRDAIAKAARARLETLAPHREAVRRAIVTLSLPQNSRMACRILYAAVDSMWIAIGDRSTDFSFYSKRALLAGVYSSTLMYWLADESHGSEDTWGFLERRIGDVMSIFKARGELEKFVARWPSPVGLARRLRYPGRQFRI